MTYPKSMYRKTADSRNHIPSIIFLKKNQLLSKRFDSPFALPINLPKDTIRESQFHRIVPLLHLTSIQPFSVGLQKLKHISAAAGAVDRSKLDIRKKSPHNNLAWITPASRGLRCVSTITFTQTLSQSRLGEFAAN
jgi:hypothetical protein